MSFHNIRDLGSSEDEAFLQNFESPMQSNDILADLCKVEDSQLDQLRKAEDIAEMEEEEDEETPEKNERRSKGRSKEKRKIFYRDKMAELMKPGEYIKQQYNYVAYTQYQQNKAPISKEEQLKRNRQSAKNSRQRKKQYVTILEKKNEENTKLIEELIDKLQQVTMERDRLKEYNHHEIKNFLKSKSEAYEKLNKVITNQTSSNDQIQLQITDMLQRFGTSGSERMAVINYYMNEVVEVLISDIHRYFLNSSAFSQGFTANNPPKNIDNEVMRILELDITKITHIVQRYRQRFLKQASVFKGLTQQFYRIFKSVQNQGKVIELVFTDMIKELQCKKVGELIMWFEQNKFSRDIKRIRREWTQQLKTGEEVVEILRKHTKQT